MTAYLLPLLYISYSSFLINREKSETDDAEATFYSKDNKFHKMDSVKAIMAFNFCYNYNSQVHKGKSKGSSPKRSSQGGADLCFCSSQPDTR